MIKIDGYVFEENSGYSIELHAVRGDRIIGSIRRSGGSISPLIWDFNGNCKSWTNVEVNLTPYDKFKDLKQAYDDGAKIEWYSDRWNDMHNCVWSEYTTYRIKGGISIESWNTHKDSIKAYWGGAVIEYKSKVDSKWWVDDCREWNTAYNYRIATHIKKMTVAEINCALGYEVEIVKG